MRQRTSVSSAAPADKPTMRKSQTIFMGKRRKAVFRNSNIRVPECKRENQAEHCCESAPGPLRRINTTMLYTEQILTQLPVFHSCSQEFIAALAANSMERSCGMGLQMARQGSLGSSMFVFLRGALVVCVDDMEVMQLSHGQCFGEPLLLGIEKHWTASLWTAAPSTVCEIERETFLTVLGQFSGERCFFHSLALTSTGYIHQGTLTDTCSVFKGLTNETIVALDATLVHRMLFPGEEILSEGQPGDELYILTWGQLTVSIAGRVVRSVNSAEQVMQNDCHTQQQEIKPEAYCFGELGMLGISNVRSATVRAKSVCHVRVLFRPVFLQILSRRNESLQLDMVAQFIDGRFKGNVQTDPQEVLGKVKIFRDVGCSQDFLDFCADHMEERVFLASQTIADENHAKSQYCMYLLRMGTASVTKAGEQIATLKSGDVCGEMVVLGLEPTNSLTVIAEETCFMHILHQNIVVKGLELFPHERQRFLALAFAGESHDHAHIQHTSCPDTLNARMRESVLRRNRMKKLLKKVNLFKSLCPEFVDELSYVAKDRIFMPGDHVIEQGQRGDSMFILVSGSVEVFLTENVTFEEIGGEVAKNSITKVGKLSPGSIGGELSMLGVAKTRVATMQAETICYMWEISQENALPIIERNDEAQKHFMRVIVEHLERTVVQRVNTLPLFQSFDQKFRMLLGIYSERRAYFPGQQIAREGCHGGGQLFVVNLGVARLEWKGVTVKTYAAGSHYGFTVMVGLHKTYIGTLVAVQTCHLVVISRVSYQSALEQYPMPVAALKTKRAERAETEVLAQEIRRIAVRKLVTQRYQDFVANKNMSMSGLIERAFHAWQRWYRHQRDRKRRQARERQDQHNQMEHWILQRETVMDRGTNKPVDQRDSSPEAPPTRLPSITHDQAALTELLKHWPTPRPSPHYKLNILNVLREAADASLLTTAPFTR